MRIVFIGCVQFSEAALNLLFRIPEAEVVGIVTRERSDLNSDFCSLESIASQRKIPVWLGDRIDVNAMAVWMRKLRPDIGYCFGWSWLIPKEVLSIPPLGMVGFHPAWLPQNRGRHPIVWALVLGLKETASTFFFMDERADSGDILSQRVVEITEENDARSLYGRITEVALGQIESFTKELSRGRVTRQPQDSGSANTWRKRNKQDGLIDWRMSARSIHNLVRALAKPYVGSHCYVNDEEVKVWKTEIVDVQERNIEPGKVLAAVGGQLVVKCGEGAIKLVAHELKRLPRKGSYM